MSVMPYSVAVLVSAGRHPLTGAARACPGDAVALAFARALASGAVRVLFAGNPDEPALADYLALGAERIEVIDLKDGADAVPSLARELATDNLVITGLRGECGLASGVLPYRLAKAMARPIVANVLTGEIENKSCRLRQFLPQGARRRIEVPLPAIITVHPSAPVALSYAHARKITGRIAYLAASSSEAPKSQSAWLIDPAPRRPERLAAPAAADGHARMLTYVEAQARGGVVAFEGTNVDKAQILLTYLRQHQLVEF